MAAAAAFLGWLLATLLLVVGIRPAGWVLLGSAAVTLIAATGYARVTTLGAAEVAAFSFACILLSWPVLGLVTLLVFSWAGIGHWE